MHVYASFDPFPAAKGAATHIAAFLHALAPVRGPWTLLTVEPSPTSRAVLPLPVNVEHVPLASPGKTLIDRVMAFRRNLLAWWGARRVEVAHVRSIFEGYPLAREKGRRCERLVYEVNALPSIELKYHYPLVAEDRDLLAKLQRQERVCLEAADLVVTPSPVTADLLRERCPGVRPVVIENGVDPGVFAHRAPTPWGPDGPRLLYAGTLASWQGVRVAIEALALYRRDGPARLTVVGAGRKRQRRALLERAYELGVADHVEVLKPCGREELIALHHASDVVLAPLMPNDRNLVQGCSPLKVVEAMALGTPLVASDLPAVRALAGDEEAVLVRPGSAKAVKDGVLRLQREAGLGARLSANARRRAEAELTWDRAGERLRAAYDEALGAAATSR
jgi:glycosyltransferase involved in cell wall biosynthesis